MDEAIDFENLGNVRQIDLVAVYAQLSALREKPEEFQRAADKLKKALIAQLGEDGQQRSSLEKLQEEIDDVVGKAPDALQGAAEVFRMMTRSFAKGSSALLDEIEIEKTMKEIGDVTIQ